MNLTTAVHPLHALGERHSIGFGSMHEHQAARRAARPSQRALPRLPRHGVIARALSRGALILAVALATAGCDTDTRSPLPPAPSASVPSHAAPDALRVRLDAARHRVWVLHVDHVLIYDARTSALVRRLDLPPWIVADFICEPDIAFDKSGSAFISHNLEPKLWQIDADSFSLREHSIRLTMREQLDIGFCELAFGPDGSLLAAASAGGSLWRIDLRNATARQLAPGSAIAGPMASGASGERQRFAGRG